jgi:hypothetical protein
VGKDKNEQMQAAGLEGIKKMIRKDEKRQELKVKE